MTDLTTPDEMTTSTTIPIEEDNDVATNDNNGTEIDLKHIHDMNNSNGNGNGIEQEVNGDIGANSNSNSNSSTSTSSPVMMEQPVPFATEVMDNEPLEPNTGNGDASVTQDLNADEEEDPFGDFASGSGEADADADAETAADIDADVHRLSPKSVEVEMEQEDDAFGEFGDANANVAAAPVDDSPPTVSGDVAEASTSGSNQVVVEEASASLDDDDDAFGGFGSAEGATMSATVSESELIKPVGPNETNGDDFGGLGGAEASDSDLNQVVVDESSALAPVDKDDDDDDDFGDFGSAEGATTTATPTAANETEQTKPVGPSETNGDDIGGAEASDSDLNQVVVDESSALAPVDKDDDENEDDDDDFGDFGSAEGATTTAMPTTVSESELIKPVGPNETNGDDFGSFGGAEASDSDLNQVVVDESSALAPVDKDDDGDDDDDFGDFGSAEGATTTATPTATTIATSTATNETEQTKPVGTKPVGHSETNGVDDDDFGNFGGAKASDSNMVVADDSSALVPVEDDDGDDFGDFGSAQEEIATLTANASNQTKPVGPSETNGDDCGDFGDVGIAEVSTSESKQVAVENASVPVDGDNFGGFGSAEAVATPMTASESEHTKPVGYSETNGDVGGAEAPTCDSDQVVVDDASALAPVDDDNDDGDFGDFGNAEVATATATATASESEETKPVGPSETNGDDADEFGDFGGAEASMSDSKPVVMEVASASTPAPADNSNDGDDDDFGDFGSAEAVTTTTSESELTKPVGMSEVNDDDDDFGDFGGAEGVTITQGKESEQVAHVAPGDDDDDDFGDFGDFDGAEVATEVTENVPTSQEAVVPSNDLLLSRLRNDFPSLFTRYSTDKAEGKEGDSSDGHAETENVTVRSILTSITDGQKESTGSALDAGALLEFLKDTSMLKKGSPRSIMLNEGKGPYDHLAFPVGGLSSNRSTSGRSQSDNMKRKAKLYLPDVLPIRLSSTEDATLPVARAPAATAPRHSNPSPTVVSLPPAPSPAKSNTEKAASRSLPPSKASVPVSQKEKGQSPHKSVKEFLKQIPNLSYMLSSELSIPQNNK